MNIETRKCDCPIGQGEPRNAIYCYRCGNRGKYPQVVSADENGWVEWHGGDCPIPSDAEIEMKHRNGHIERGAADKYRWFHLEGPHDIIAYRVPQTSPFICTICGEGKQALNGECACAGSKKNYSKPLGLAGLYPDVDEQVRKDVLSDIDATLTERGKRYGSFPGHAKITWDIKRAIASAPKYGALADDQKEALDMFAHKIGRILNGDPDYHDSWHDIVGYAKLVADRLEKEQQ